ncbi:hypothetical protein CYMTET_45347, partial [Cymbomonas tetramitiformis]
MPTLRLAPGSLSGPLVLARSPPRQSWQILPLKLAGFGKQRRGPTPNAAAVVVFGANGRVGRRCVVGLARRKQQVVAVSRSGNFDSSGLSLSGEELACIVAKKGDVCDLSSLAETLVGASGAIFVASASKGASPFDVDRDGAINVARACISSRVPRFVLVTSGGVSKPSSPIYKYNNLYGGLMQAKFEGEDGTRRLYAAQEESVQSDLGYTIIRPGGITDEPQLGVDYLELSQGESDVLVMLRPRLIAGTAHGSMCKFEGDFFR